MFDLLEHGCLAYWRVTVFSLLEGACLTYWRVIVFVLLECGLFGLLEGDSV